MFTGTAAARVCRAAGGWGSPLSVLLRIYCLQQWYQHSDPGADLFDVTNGAFIEADTTNRADNFVMWAGFQEAGGVQQFWCESGWAYWAPAMS